MSNLLGTDIARLQKQKRSHLHPQFLAEQSLLLGETTKEVFKTWAIFTIAGVRAGKLQKKDQR
jgi:hypothetical protein